MTNVEKYNEENIKALSGQLRDLIISKMNYSIRAWSDVIDMQTLAIDDAEKMMRVCQLINELSFNTAYYYYRQLDTSPREYLAEFIEEVFGETIYDLREYAS